MVIKYHPIKIKEFILNGQLDSKNRTLTSTKSEKKGSKYKEEIFFMRLVIHNVYTMICNRKLKK